MDTNTIINKLSLKEKLLNLFIIGYNSPEEFETLQKLVNKGLGGVIFFADNLKTREKFVNLVNTLQKKAPVPLFISIDQEGGLIERTIKLDKKINYLTPLTCSKLEPNDFYNHYHIMAKDLNSLGFNLNFAPCSDVNTQKSNPIIGVRSYSSDVNKAKKLSQICSSIFKENDIIPVLKHFPGHGDSKIDSHLDMPTINLTLDELESKHISAFRQKADMIMVAHAYYPCFDDTKTPASLSQNVISYLKNNVGFEGVIISDDMIMGGVANYYEPADACIKALKAGIHMFIFRNASRTLFKTIEKVYQKVLEGELDEKIIENAFQKVLKLKNKYNLCPVKQQPDIEKAQEEINKMAISAIKKQDNITLAKGKTLIISPNKTQIYNLSFDNTKLSDFIKADEIFYDLTLNDDFILEIKEKQNEYENIIFVGYNTLLSESQQKLADNLNNYIAISIGVDENTECFQNARGVITLNGYNKPIINALKSNFPSP